MHPHRHTWLFSENREPTRGGRGCIVGFPLNGNQKRVYHVEVDRQKSSHANLCFLVSLQRKSPVFAFVWWFPLLFWFSLKKEPRVSPIRRGHSADVDAHRFAASDHCHRRMVHHRGHGRQVCLKSLKLCVCVCVCASFLEDASFWVGLQETNTGKCHVPILFHIAINQFCEHEICQPPADDPDKSAGLGWAIPNKPLVVGDLLSSIGRQ